MPFGTAKYVSNLPVLILGLALSAGTAAAEETQRGIDLSSDTESTIVVSKVPVTDSRAVRGFLATPVDGTVNTRGYRGDIVEYPDTGKEGYDAGAGVDYSYNGNDGLHIRFGDSDGFNAVVIRGAARTEMFPNTGQLLEPGDMRPLAAFDGDAQVECMVFSQKTGKSGVSFFGTDRGALADIGFYRIDKTAKAPAGKRFRVTNIEPEIEIPASEFAPESIYKALDELYPGNHGRLFSLGENGDGIALSANEPVHFMSPAYNGKTGLDAVTLDFSLDSDAVRNGLTLIVQDPLDPRLSMMYVPLTLTGSGAYRISLDFPDQVIFKGRRLWMTVIAGNDMKLAGPDGGSPLVTISEITADQAFSEAFAYRKLLLKSFFIIMSESRPWGRYRKQSRDEFYASYSYAGLCPELFMTIDICHELAPEDDLIRQYREWVYLRNLDHISEINPPPSPPAGVPDWAWYPRMAWLEDRKIAEWWLENRLVPTGEFGGMVGDDSDLYQQFADLPYYESGAVAAQVKEAAARLAELADKKHLRDGINVLMTDGLHAYEEGINHLALMAQWHYGDPVYLERCMDSARNMEKLTTVTPDGRRHFRNSVNLGYAEMENPSEPQTDGGSAALLWHTSLQTADYNRNPRVMKTLDEWAQSWLGKMKPGAWPAEIDVRSGTVTQADKNNPFSPRGQELSFTWLAKLTGKKEYIEPYLYYYRQGEASSSTSRFLGDIFNMGFLDDVGREHLDALAARNSALSLYINGDPEELIKDCIGDPANSGSAIRNLSDAMRFPDMYTTVEQYTDRLFPSIIASPSICTLGGFSFRNRYLPARAVSWEEFGTDYGALVLVNRPDSLKVLVYSFSDKEIDGTVRVWALRHGRYRVRSGSDRNGDRNIDGPGNETLTELRKADTIPLSLEPKAVTVLEIGLAEKLDSIFGRADLAIAAREFSVSGRTVRGILHNIGSEKAEAVTIAVLDANGAAVMKKKIDNIEAPLDLVPRRIEFTLTLPEKPGNGWQIVVDPADKIDEIYEGNNAIQFSEIR